MGHEDFKPNKVEATNRELTKSRKSYEQQVGKTARQNDGGLLEQLKKRIKGEKLTDSTEIMQDDAEKENTDRELDKMIERIDPVFLGEFFRARDIAETVVEECKKYADDGMGSAYAKGTVEPQRIQEIINKAAEENKISPHLIRMNISEFNGGTMTDYQSKVGVLRKELAMAGADASFELGGVLHSKWQSEFKNDNPKDSDRFKPVKDEEWAKKCKDLCTEPGEVVINRNTEKQQIIKAQKSPDGKIAIGEDGKLYLDILNSSYDELSNDWKGENKESAEVAISEVQQWAGVRDGDKLSSSSRDMISKTVHDEWLKRNPWAPEHQQKPFDDLSEEEKNKDRIIVDGAHILYKKRLEQMHFVKKN